MKTSLYAFCIAALLTLILCSPAHAQTQCVTVQVSTAKVADIPKLLADAECFEALATTARTPKLRKSYLQSAKYRRDKATALQATIPPPGPVVIPPPPPPVDNGLPSLPSITSNFDIAANLAPAEIPPKEDGGIAAPGAFRFICSAGHLSYDDPIVYPGQPGKSHLHQFFGNTKVDAHSTYESLRTAGESTCNNALNRSAYWMPAMMDGRGNVVRPDYVAIYYKRHPKSSTYCTPGGFQFQGICVDLPRGLRFIFGYDMLTGKTPTGAAWFNCDGPGAVGGHYPDIPTAAVNCPVGSKLGAVIFAPDCWDGKNLDSPNHRDHVAYADYSSGLGFLQCPKTHPYLIPQFQLGAWYTTDASLDRSGTWEPARPTWHLSSDVMPDHMMKPGTTFHSDWFGAWDDFILKLWHDNCIDKQLSCNSGNLGDGRMMKILPGPNYSYTANPRLVAVPPRP